MLGTMLTKEELDEFMREADVVRQQAEEEELYHYYYRVLSFQDGNGKLDYDEFVKMLLSTEDK